MSKEILSDKAKVLLKENGFRPIEIENDQYSNINIYFKTDGKCDIDIYIEVFNTYYMLGTTIENDRESARYTMMMDIDNDLEHIIYKDQIENVIDFLNENINKLKW